MTFRCHLLKWDEGKGNTGIENGTYRQMELIGYTDRPSGIDTTHTIGLGFSQIITQ